MSRKNAVLLASRTLAALLMVRALTDISYLPTRLYSFLHYLNREPSLEYTEYMRHLDFIDLGFAYYQNCRLFAFLDASVQSRPGYPGVTSSLGSAG